MQQVNSIQQLEGLIQIHPETQEGNFIDYLINKHLENFGFTLWKFGFDEEADLIADSIAPKSVQDMLNKFSIYGQIRRYSKMVALWPVIQSKFRMLHVNSKVAALSLKFYFNLY